MITFLSSAVIARGAAPDRSNAVAVAMRIPSRSALLSSAARRLNSPAGGTLPTWAT